MSKIIYNNRKEKKINAISIRANTVLLVILTLFAALCILPLLLVIIVQQ